MVEMNAICGVRVSGDGVQPERDMQQQQRPDEVHLGEHQPQLYDEDDDEPPGAKRIWFGKVWKDQRFDTLPQNSINWHLNPKRSHRRWYQEFCELNDKHNAWKARKKAREEVHLRQAAIVFTREGNDQAETSAGINRDGEEHRQRVEGAAESDVKGRGELKHVTDSQADSTPFLECSPCAITAVLSGVAVTGTEAHQVDHQNHHESPVVEDKEDEQFSQSFSQLSVASSRNDHIDQEKKSRKDGISSSHYDSQYIPSPTPSDDTPNGTQAHLGRIHTRAYSQLSPRPTFSSRSVRASSLERFLENDHDSNFDDQEYVPSQTDEGDTTPSCTYSLRSGTNNLSKEVEDANKVTILDDDLDRCHASRSDSESDAESYPVRSLTGRRFSMVSFTEYDDSGIEMVANGNEGNKGVHKSTNLLSKRSHEHLDDEEPEGESSGTRKSKRRFFRKS